MRDLRIGDAVEAIEPDVTGYVFDVDHHHCCAVVMVPVTFGLAELRRATDMPPCPYIPRERVADLHAAVAKRVERLEAEGMTPRRDEWCDDECMAAAGELSEIAEALRLLLEVDDGPR